MTAGLGAPMAKGSVRLEPMAEAHRAGLKAACAEDLEIWPIYATSWDPAHFDATFERTMTLPNWCRFVIFAEGALAGMSCFINVDPDRGALEIGNTYYVPALRGSGFNLAVKDLMIRRAIVSGFRRIEFKVDSRNARSQAAMAKLGATREGVIRADRITWTGHVRDTVLFSILASEWDRSAGVQR
jgi:RimJ/RimL family protein N-acetyltransferase